MSTREVVCIIASVALCVTYSATGESHCYKQVDQYFDAHTRWLTDTQLYVEGAFVGVIVGDSVYTKAGRLLGLSGDDPEDPRPTLCTKELDRNESGRVNLSNKNLVLANFKDAFLIGANLEGSNLILATMKNADLKYANLKSANLSQSFLEEASLVEATMTKANLRFAILRGADLAGAIVEDAILAGADLNDTIYTPNASKPPSSDITNIKGVSQIRIVGENNEGGTAQLRKIFKELGLRKHEREATHAIERHRARIGGIFGFLRYLFFGVPTGWGLWPAKAWIGIGGLMTAASVLYWRAIESQRTHQKWNRSGIYRVHLADYLIPACADMTIANTSQVVHIRPCNVWWSILWALYFGLLSCFHIGWRDLNVGLWLTRVQPKEFALRGHGWVRLVSGVQSLVSVYLLAIWALTYFGRPFE